MYAKVLIAHLFVIDIFYLYPPSPSCIYSQYKFMTWMLHVTSPDSSAEKNIELRWLFRLGQASRTK